MNNYYCLSLTAFVSISIALKYKKKHFRPVKTTQNLLVGSFDVLYIFGLLNTAK